MPNIGRTTRFDSLGQLGVLRIGNDVNRATCEAAGVRFRFEQAVSSTVVVFDRPGLQVTFPGQFTVDGQPAFTEREQIVLAILAAKRKAATSDFAREAEIGRKTAAKILKEIAGRGLPEWVGGSTVFLSLLLVYYSHTGYNPGNMKGVPMATSTLSKSAEIKTRTYADVKARATEVYSHWGISLNDAINIFLVKSIDVGGLPFEMRSDGPSYEALAAVAYKAPINDDGIAVLPADWADDE